MAIFRDISLGDKTLRQALVTAWQQNDMATVLQKLADAQAANKGVKAAVMNGITTALTTAQQAAETRYKTGRIKTSSTTPAGMTSGQVFFKEGGEEPSSVTITWDGDSTGKTIFDAGGAYLTKISPPIEFASYPLPLQISTNVRQYEATGSNIAFSGGGMVYTIQLPIDAPSSQQHPKPFICIVDSLPFTLADNNFQETGVYFMGSSSEYVTSATIEYEPRDTLFTWDGNIDGKPYFELDGATFYKVAELPNIPSYPNSSVLYIKDNTDNEQSVSVAYKADNVSGGVIYDMVIVATSTTIQTTDGTIQVPETGIYAFWASIPSASFMIYVSRFEIKTQQ